MGRYRQGAVFGACTLWETIVPGLLSLYIYIYMIYIYLYLHFKLFIPITILHDNAERVVYLANQYDHCAYLDLVALPNRCCFFFSHYGHVYNIIYKTAWSLPIYRKPNKQYIIIHIYILLTFIYIMSGTWTFRLI